MQENLEKHVFVLIVCELMEQLQYIDKYFNNSKKSITDFFSRLWKNWITNSINTLKNVMKTCDWEKPNSSKAKKVVIPPLTIAGPIFKRLLTARSSRVPRKINILYKYSKSKYMSPKATHQARNSTNVDTLI